MLKTILFLFALTSALLWWQASSPALAQVSVLANGGDDAKIKAAVEDRYQEWLVAANKKDVTAMTSHFFSDC